MFSAKKIYAETLKLQDRKLLLFMLYLTIRGTSTHETPIGAVTVCIYISVYIDHKNRLSNLRLDCNLHANNEKFVK